MERNPDADELRRALETCRAERAELAERAESFRRFLEQLTGGYFFYRHDTERVYTYLSPSVEQVLGWTREEYVANYVSLFTDAPMNVEALACIDRAIAGEAQYCFEIEIRAKDGGKRFLEISEVPVVAADGGVRFVEGIAHDVTERKRLQNRLHDLATIDELTGLFNRRHLVHRIEEGIALARRHGFTLSVALIDLDGLKAVNDNFGHAAGDRLIQATAEILQHELRRGDVLGRVEIVAGRVGGDEFAALLPYARSPQARLAMQRVLDAFARAEVEVAPGVTHRLHASIGIAELREGDDPDVLQGRADEALYRAKRSGRGKIVLYSEIQP
jgi:diguanylate cyclase (GGDEF)-like protein/PAS domain S-box-containing protein